MSEAELTDSQLQARGRALSHPLRLRILRVCQEPRTNKELAEIFEMNTGTMLHHVRTLVKAGFLTAEAERSGAQGAREVPYIATGLSWKTPIPRQSRVLVEAFNQEIAALLPEDRPSMAWLGLRLSQEHRDELTQRLRDLAEEFKQRGPDSDGERVSLFFSLHDDRTVPAAEAIS